MHDPGSEGRRTRHRRTSGAVKLHSWVTALGQQGTEPDLRIYAVVHRCEGIHAVLQRALRALYALANSNRSAPLSVSRAQNRKPFSFCTREPTGRYRLEYSSGSLACGPCTFGDRARSEGGRR